MASPAVSFVVFEAAPGDFRTAHLLNPGSTSNSHTTICRYFGIKEDEAFRVELLHGLQDATEPIPWGIDTMPSAYPFWEDAPAGMVDLIEEACHAFMTLENVHAYICTNGDGLRFAERVLTEEAYDEFHTAYLSTTSNRAQASYLNSALARLIHRTTTGKTATAADQSRTSSVNFRPLTDDDLRNPNIWPHLYKKEKTA